MNKTALIAEITDRCGVDVTKAEVKAILETFEAVVIESCSNGDPVTLTGFVKFARQDRKARQGRNPATGETIQIAAKSVPKATALKGFKDQVMENTEKAKRAAKRKAGGAKKSSKPKKSVGQKKAAKKRRS